MRFVYTNVCANHPVFPLGGRYFRPRPIAAVSLLGPAGVVAVDALLDPGADDTVFLEATATLIGVDLTNAPQGFGKGIGGTRLPLRYALVTLRMADSQEEREWQGWIGFATGILSRPLLGYCGVLQFFDVMFRGALMEVELTRNISYPGI